MSVGWNKDFVQRLCGMWLLFSAYHTAPGYTSQQALPPSVFPHHPLPFLRSLHNGYITIFILTLAVGATIGASTRETITKLKD
ncbi:hypothetical protein EDB19DRAFT_1732497 [Suillus lakei]|nr:hypothetical protein EDB19DRAFT_1732497 [Suillus lakei]